MVGALEPFVVYMLWFVLIAWLVSPIVVYFTARQKGLDPVSWAAGAILFGPFALLALELAPAGERRSRTDAPESEHLVACPHCHEPNAAGSDTCERCQKPMEVGG